MNEIVRVKKEAIDQIPIILVGNMNDLEEERVVSTEDGEKLAEKFCVPFFETNTKELKNVEELFSSMVQLMRSEIT